MHSGIAAIVTLVATASTASTASARPSRHGWFAVVPVIDTGCDARPDPCDRYSPAFAFASRFALTWRGANDLVIGWSLDVKRDHVLILRSASTFAVRTWLDLRHWAEYGVGVVRRDLGVDFKRNLPSGRELFFGLGDSFERVPGDGTERAVRVSVTSVANESRVMIDFTMGSWARF